MATTYEFLFFLQRQLLYFKFQDQILDLLTTHPKLGLNSLQSKLSEFSLELVESTKLVMSQQPNPFPNSDIQRIKYGDHNYPREFTHLTDPPLVFSLLGRPLWDEDKISVVGSRWPSQKSLWWLAKELKPILSKNRFVSVSGGAIGIDQLVHQASIDLKLPTIAILPSGLKDIYPRSFGSIANIIIENGGCLISEFADYQPVRKHHFSFRNRLIASLGKISIIVEARQKSGSLITAHRALEMGKDIFVVPGHPLDDSFQGSVQLLKMGAHIITQSDDIEFWC